MHVGTFVKVHWKRTLNGHSNTSKKPFFLWLRGEGCSETLPHSGVCPALARTTTRSNPVRIKIWKKQNVYLGLIFIYLYGFLLIDVLWQLKLVAFLMGFSFLRIILIGCIVAGTLNPAVKRFDFLVSLFRPHFNPPVGNLEVRLTLELWLDQGLGVCCQE